MLQWKWEFIFQLIRSNVFFFANEIKTMNKLAGRWSLRVYFLTIIWQIAAYDTILQQNCSIKPTKNPAEKQCNCSTLEFLFTSDNSIIITCSSPVLLSSTVLKQVLDLCNYTIPLKLKDLIIRRCPVNDLSFVQPFARDAESSLYNIFIDNFQRIDSTAESSDIQILRSVQQFSIKNSNFTTLPESIFRYMKNLTIFSMYNCTISTLSGDLFKPVIHLDELSMHSNNLTSLESNLFHFVSNLTHLNLAHNHLQELPIDIFHNLVNLTILDLSYNKLERLEAGIFDHLQHLKDLYLNDNQFYELPRGLFASLTSLVSVNMYSNHLAELPADLFQNCVHLESISLTNNALIRLPNILFRDTSHLIRLDLSNNKLQDSANRSSDDYAIPSDSFQNCTSLKFLTLKTNALKALSSSTFKNTTFLQILYLNDNQIQFLNDTIFESLTNLVELNLAKNHLETVGENLFAHLQSLTTLDLSHNRLKDLDELVYRNLRYLNHLDLSHNQLTLDRSGETLDDKSPFHACEKLKTLHLKNNLLRTIFHDWKQLKELVVLDLSWNQFQSITSKDLFFKKRCHAADLYINLASNNITSIKLNDLNELMRSDNTLRQNSSCDGNNQPNIHVLFDFVNNSIICDCNMFYAAKNLQNGTLSSANIRFDHGLCYGPDSMKNRSLDSIPLHDITCPFHSTLMKCPENCTCKERLANESIIVNCTGANLKKFPRNLLTFSNVILELEFANNSLKSITELSNLSSTVNVTTLSLSFNKLQNIDTVTLLNGLKILKIDHNQLSNLNDTVIGQLNASKTLTTISLNDNPWQCDCKSQQFKDFIHWNVKTKKIHISHKANIICHNGEPIIGLLHRDFCETFIQKVRPFAYVVGFILLIITIVVIYRIYKYQIKVWMFSHPFLSWLVTEKEIDKTKTYDAFVSYSTKDESFVVEQLIPKLEKNDHHRFKLCIHYRDFYVGEYIPNQIINAIEDSRRTIFLLSPNFLESMWTRMEFRIAYLKAIKERCTRVIIILLDEIRTDNLDSELKTYITMNTYLKWGDPWFWEKLMYALPHREIVNRCIWKP